jgi:hypothetical protein
MEKARASTDVVRAAGWLGAGTGARASAGADTGGGGVCTGAGAGAVTGGSLGRGLAPVTPARGRVGEAVVGVGAGLVGTGRWVGRGVGEGTEGSGAVAGSAEVDTGPAENVVAVADGLGRAGLPKRVGLGTSAAVLVAGCVIHM